MSRGFTDDVPIHSPRYPTNWELSAARAASIVRLLGNDGVEPSRMAAVGYGEFQPVADNASAEGRAKNRRVVLVISRNLEVRRSVSGVGSGKAQPDSALRHAGSAAGTQAADTGGNAGARAGNRQFPVAFAMSARTMVCVRAPGPNWPLARPQPGRPMPGRVEQ